ncbi:hypothetical protein P168DRAFT_272398 [Aspergillus campestris IBT 28561]|uniref:Uncharacterized protein n=1 Tax=Aspergillus campestris (strain IBT 28561) TaxID=1392248 RepID=A0A2I1CZ03_ASPC2|nr:uncharacterized protein P168DRAFT_272398 [Aspergillus campestris IBT 28561]PKY02844.1 hypothetical protein P168DRAFT_272398 [Aspergillus campestris IBT 28561]
MPPTDNDNNNNNNNNNDLPGVYTNTTPGPAPNGLGQGLFATKAIPAGGDVLNIKTPFVAVLDTERLEDTCSGCFGRRYLGGDSDDVTLRACTGCRVVRYCDRTCQSKDWKLAHSLECPTFKKLTPRVLPNNARALLRIVQRVQRGKYVPAELDRFAQLETHEAAIRAESPRQWERISLSAKAVGAYSGGGMGEEEICGVGAKLDLNSFNLTNAQYDRIGLYLHPYAALINHSCAYNAVAGFDGAELFVKAVRPISNDEQVFISYVDTTNPTQLRRQELRERYFFDCACSKCSSSAQDEGQQEQQQGMEAFKILRSTPASTSNDDDPVRRVERLQSALREVNTSTSCPITSQPIVALRDELIASLLSAGMFYAAFAHAAVRYVRVDPVVYPFVGHPIRAVHAWALAKLAIHLSQGGEGGVGAGDGGEKEVRAAVERLGLNLGLVIWSVLRGLVVGEGAACAVPGFRGVVGSAFGEVQGEFVRNGIEPGRMGVEIGREWEKVGRLVGGVIEGEGGK